MIRRFGQQDGKINNGMIFVSKKSLLHICARLNPDAPVVMFFIINVCVRNIMN